MIHIVKTCLVLFILGWSFFGIWMVARYDVLFGPHHDDPAESAGARSFGVTHIFLVWSGFLSLAEKIRVSVLSGTVLKRM